MTSTVIKVKNLSKTFRIKESQSRTIRDSFYDIFKKNNSWRKVKALQDINFEVQKGEIFGIVGRNGSGKSTLLNCIMGSLESDLGSIIEVKGKMIRLALGMGFDPNLSARDNIYVNGSILGLTFKRIGLIFDDIIGFAELEDFVDVPVKAYSSGMMAKLKFSIAIYAKADIFLMDEFFGGVGDESFKKKSEEVFRNTFLDGRTILLVSHSLSQLENTCHRAMILNGGKQLTIDDGPTTVNKYKQFLEKSAVRRTTSKN